MVLQVFNRFIDEDNEYIDKNQFYSYMAILQQKL